MGVFLSFLIFLSFLNSGIMWGGVMDGVYYCLEYEREELLEGGKGYSSCIEEGELMGKKHYKVKVLGGKVREVEFRWEGIWRKEEYRYHKGGVKEGMKEGMKEGVSFIERGFFCG